MTTLPKAPQGSIPNYRQQIRRSLPDEYFKPNSADLAWFLFHIGVVGGSLWLLKAHFAWWLAPILSVAIGHSFACCGFLAHEVGHGAVLKSPFLRDVIAAFGFSPFGIGPYLWRRWHNSDHHNNTQVEGVDPDHLFTIEDYKHNPVLRALYAMSPLLRNIIIFSSFSYRMSQQNFRMVLTYLRSEKTTNGFRAVIILQFVVPIALWVAGTLALGTQVFWWGYFVPMLVANTIAISYIATNHFLNPLADENDVLATSLTVTLPGWLKWLDPMHSRFGAHVAHHLFPQVPAKYARKVEKAIEEKWPDRYHSMPIMTALRMLWNTPWVYEDNTTLLDPKREIRVKTLGHGMEVKRKRKPRKEKAGV